MAERRAFAGGPVVALLVAAFLAFLLGPAIQRTAVVFGIFRRFANSTIADDGSFTVLGDTRHCEDLHYHEPSGLLFTACESESGGVSRHSWFPPLCLFDDAKAASTSRGSFKVIDPKTMHVKSLPLQNFDKPFVTHGIDVLEDSDRPLGEAVWIFAVNHVPNDEHYAKHVEGAPKSRSVVEVFHYLIGTDSVRHIRTVSHSLITTPNDILALTPTSFFVTNDHHYREGFMRRVEDMFWGAKWSNTVYVQYEGAGSSDDEGVGASIALEGLHNNNGIGRGRGPQEVAVIGCCSGLMHVGTIDRHTIRVSESVEFDSMVDNPSYFRDPYANATYDASGFVLCGLSRAVDLLAHSRDGVAKDGVMVWKASSTGGHEWNKTLLFEDDGSRIRTGSSAVLVALDPADEGGLRRGRLFVTGFMSRNMIAVDIDL
ncbi:serum paraoxonase/arylesterase family protein [Drechmeria coniospora]|uniref:Serum paraoxonase/arylesterase family protein n=1 Tax=Drechmeria coniospora TaxID=98403 RepID=A0A151GA79_DRECN|nr:serum paraoxonase/arylesterase family protein [Drechmeria coniospora]KYK53990.1 serum paraoxonase/arylesterase family protein [Drechmeria coniospora]ODA78220.1 hypothetical protein RJ55_05601 [Drechmeria coniospora]